LVFRTVPGLHRRRHHHRHRLCRSCQLCSKLMLTISCCCRRRNPCGAQDYHDGLASLVFNFARRGVKSLFLGVSKYSPKCSMLLWCLLESQIESLTKCTKITNACNWALIDQIRVPHTLQFWEGSGFFALHVSKKILL
jgi:hypothetical protein